jgi:hypothetical protein
MMTIRNVGQGTLSFSISDVETSSSSSPGPTIIPGGGGPDAFGYTYKDSTEMGGPAYQWIEINATGTDMGLSDDSRFWPINLPWSFDFYGTPYNQVAVGSNGTVYFTDAYLGLSNVCLPGDGGYGVPTFIAGYWDDLNPGVDGAVYYEIRGSPGSRMLIVEWNNVPHFGTSDPLTYEVILFEGSNSILVQYLDASSEAGSDGTIGIQSNLTTNYLEYSCNAPALQDSLAICFAYPGQPSDCSTLNDAPWLSEYPTSGTVVTGDSQNVDVTIDATGLAVDTYTADIIITNNDPDENPVIVPVTLHVESGPTYCISGYVWDGSGGGIGGVTVSFSDDGSTTTTGNGYYSRCGFSNGIYTITPSKAGCTLIPPPGK